MPATAASVGVTPLLVARAILLNGIIGIAAGYLFWQYGLGAAMLAHLPVISSPTASAMPSPKRNTRRRQRRWRERLGT